MFVRLKNDRATLKTDRHVHNISAVMRIGVVSCLILEIGKCYYQMLVESFLDALNFD